MTRKATKPSPRKILRSRIIETSPATVALCELFAEVDAVLTEEDAFSDAHVKKSLGRIHRQWKKTRQVLDPDFDPKRYPKRPRRAKGQQTSSSDRRLTLDLNPKQRRKLVKQLRERSAPNAP